MGCMYLYDYVLECQKNRVILVSCPRCHGNQQNVLNWLLHGVVDISKFHGQIVMKIDTEIRKRMCCDVSKAVWDVLFQYFSILFFVTDCPKILPFQVNLTFELRLLNKTHH